MNIKKLHKSDDAAYEVRPLKNGNTIRLTYLQRRTVYFTVNETPFLFIGGDPQTEFSILLIRWQEAIYVRMKTEEIQELLDLLSEGKIPIGFYSQGAKNLFKKFNLKITHEKKKGNEKAIG